jgi:hypothetical protein
MTSKRTDTASSSRSTALPVTPDQPAARATAAAKAVPASRPRVPRPAPRTNPPPAPVQAAPDASDEQARRDRIALAAYLRAERAGFLTDPVQDWLAAERELEAHPPVPAHGAMHQA